MRQLAQADAANAPKANLLLVIVSPGAAVDRRYGGQTQKP
jgi:hypothetical protein